MEAGTISVHPFEDSMELIEQARVFSRQAGNLRVWNTENYDGAVNQFFSDLPEELVWYFGADPKVGAVKLPMALIASRYRELLAFDEDDLWALSLDQGSGFSLELVEDYEGGDAVNGPWGKQLLLTIWGAKWISIFNG